MDVGLFVSFYINILLFYCFITAFFYIYELRGKLKYREFQTHRAVQTDPSTPDYFIRVVIDPDNSIKISDHAVG